MDSPAPAHAPPRAGALPLDGKGLVGRAYATMLAMAVCAVAVALPTLNPEAGAWGDVMEVVGLAALAIALVPERMVGVVQLVGLLAVWVCFRFAFWEGVSSWVLFAAPAAAAVLTMVLPVERPRVRKGVILAATAGLGGLLLVELPHEEHLLGATLQFLVAVETLGRLGGARRLRDVVRCYVTGNVAPATPVPVEDALATDRSSGSVLRGAAWVALGLFLLASYQQLFPLDLFNPWRVAAEGRPVAASGHALGYWAWRFLRICGVFLVDAGTLRLLGVPARAPVDAPWKASDFLDYWKRANVWRYKMLSEVYFRNFFPATGRLLPYGILVVFLVSGLHHAVIAKWPGFVFLRWIVDGLGAAATAWWKQWRARARVKAFVAKKPRRTVPRWQQLGLAVALPLAVLVSHGFLMEVSRPDKPLREMIWTVFPREAPWEESREEKRARIKKERAAKKAEAAKAKKAAAEPATPAPPPAADRTAPPR